jgi:hypothetical protein
MPEAKLADRAAMYERALQNSVKLRSSTSLPTTSSGPAHANTNTNTSRRPSSSSATARASLDVNSALGESYDDTQPVFAGERAEGEREEGGEDEEFVDGGIMGLLGNIYEQRRTVL